MNGLLGALSPLNQYQNDHAYQRALYDAQMQQLYAMGGMSTPPHPPEINPVLLLLEPPTA